MNLQIPFIDMIKGSIYVYILHIQKKVLLQSDLDENIYLNFNQAVSTD